MDMARNKDTQAQDLLGWRRGRERRARSGISSGDAGGMKTAFISVEEAEVT